MEMLESKELIVPLWQMLIYVGVITLCLLLRRLNLSLVTSYIFSFYWGYLYNWGVISISSQQMDQYSIVYIAFGAMLLILALISFMTHEYTT